MTTLEQAVSGSANPFNILPVAAQTSPRRRTADDLLLGTQRSDLTFSNDGLYGNLPVELFKTERNFYAFDARNVCFLKIDETLFDVLEMLRGTNADLPTLVSSLTQHTAERVQAAYQEVLRCQEEGLFTPYNFERAPNHENSDYERVLSESMGGLTIFVTTKCNLGCSYCIYGGQYDQHEKLSQVAMSWETIRNAMTFLKEHSKKSQSIRVDFFGGEPLVNFPMIKRGIEYLKQIVAEDGPEVMVTITSNGTILSEEILEFLTLHKVFIQFSIDGGADVHDKNRRFKGNGKGSFATILANLQRIYDHDHEYFRSNTRIKGVITTETLPDEDLEFYRHPLIKLIISEEHFTHVDEEPHYDLAKDADYFARLEQLRTLLLEMDGLESERDITRRLTPRQAGLYGLTFGDFFEYQVIGQSKFLNSDAVPFSKGCLTGYQEGAVSSNGDISICLKSAKGDNFVIGNVNEGQWYYEKMKELNTAFHRDWPGCKSCYLQKVCDLCYEKLDGQDGSFYSGRNNYCQFNRARFRFIFQAMLSVCERNPKLWNYLERTVEQSLGKSSTPCF